MNGHSTVGVLRDGQKPAKGERERRKHEREREGKHEMGKETPFMHAQCSLVNPTNSTNLVTGAPLAASASTLIVHKQNTQQTPSTPMLTWQLRRWVCFRRQRTGPCARIQLPGNDGPRTGACSAGQWWLFHGSWSRGSRTREHGEGILGGKELQWINRAETYTLTRTSPLVFMYMKTFWTSEHLTKKKTILCDYHINF